MNFLSVHEVRKIAVRKGCTIERNSTVKNVTYVRLTNAKGVGIDPPGGYNGFTLSSAKRYLETLPDHAPRPVRRALAAKASTPKRTERKPDQKR